MLRLYGLTPAISDLKVLCPYAFVVNWFVKIKEYFDHLEMMSIQQRLPFIYGVLGTKDLYRLERDFLVGTHSFHAKLRFVFYNRKVIKEFPDDVWLGKLFGDPRKHLVTGGALLIQYLAE